MEFSYVDRGVLSANHDASLSPRRPIHLREEKWWLPVPRVPPGGLNENTRKQLELKRDSTNQILKAAMAINSNALSEMEIPQSYLDSLPKVCCSSSIFMLICWVATLFLDSLCSHPVNLLEKLLELRIKNDLLFTYCIFNFCNLSHYFVTGLQCHHPANLFKKCSIWLWVSLIWLFLQNGRASLGDVIYRYITSDKFSPECLLDCLDFASEHQALDIANRVEASIHIWRRRTTVSKPTNNTRPSWGIVKEMIIDADKRELLAGRAETLLLCLKQRFPGLTQTTLDVSKIQFNKVRIRYHQCRHYNTIASISY